MSSTVLFPSTRKASRSKKQSNMLSLGTAMFLTTFNCSTTFKIEEKFTQSWTAKELRFHDMRFWIEIRVIQSVMSWLKAKIMLKLTELFSISLLLKNQSPPKTISKSTVSKLTIDYDIPVSIQYLHLLPNFCWWWITTTFSKDWKP